MRIVFCIGVLLGVIIGAYLGKLSGIYYVQEGAISHGVAGHDYVTGDFIWAAMPPPLSIELPLPKNGK